MEPSTLCSDAASSVTNTQQKYIGEAAPVLSQLILHCLQAFKLSQKVDFWKRLEPDSLLFQVHATPPISFNLPTQLHTIIAPSNHQPSQNLSLGPRPTIGLSNTPGFRGHIDALEESFLEDMVGMVWVGWEMESAGFLTLGPLVLTK